MESHDMINIILTITMCYLVVYVYVYKHIEKFENCVCPTAPECNCLSYKGGSFANRLFGSSGGTNQSYWTGNRTRGEPGDYMLVGLLYNSTMNKNYKLYGRRTYPGSPQWEYLVVGKDIGGLDIDVPLSNKDEIMDGSIVSIPIDSNQYTVKIYNYNDLIYNSDPNVLYHA